MAQALISPASLTVCSFFKRLSPSLTRPSSPSPLPPPPHLLVIHLLPTPRLSVHSSSVHSHLSVAHFYPPPRPPNKSANPLPPSPYLSLHSSRVHIPICHSTHLLLLILAPPPPPPSHSPTGSSLCRGPSFVCRCLFKTLSLKIRAVKVYHLVSCDRDLHLPRVHKYSRAHVEHARTRSRTHTSLDTRARTRTHTHTHTHAHICTPTNT